MTHRSTHADRSHLRSSKQILARAIEPLERRRMLCTSHYDFANYARDFPGEAQMLADFEAANLAGDMKTARGGLSSQPPNEAIINWSNRGTSGDNFASTFGANAETAREVVDAVIRHYERVITSFNHFNDSNVINVTISMEGSGTGHGGGAGSYSENAAGQPIGGAITLGRGNDLNGDGRGDGGGYFIDTTPDDYSEFNGGFANAFAVDAMNGSAAFNQSDLYSLVAAELTHVLGINSGSNLYHSRGHYTNTNIADTAEGGGVGKFYVYDSSVIKHLMTSNNGGAGGSDRGKPLHSAGPAVPITFNGLTWEGAEDSMNASYEFGRRYLVPETSRLIMQDGLLYTTTAAQTFGTAYGIVNQTARTLTVRGNTGLSPDTITVDFSNNKIVVTVDVPFDFAGTWTAPGGGDFPAWRMEFNPIDFDTITINAGDGNDTIRVLGTHPLITTTVNAGLGNDFIQVGDGVIDGGIISQVSVFGSGGTDTLSYNDAFDTVGNDVYQITSTFIQKTSGNFTRVTHTNDIEAISVNGSETSNTFNVDSVSQVAAYTLFGLGGDDTFNITPPSAIAMTVHGGIGNNTLRLNDAAATSAQTYSISNSSLGRTNSAAINYNQIQNLIVDGTSGANQFNLATENGSPSITLNGNDGNDFFRMDVSRYTTPGGQNPITINGGVGTSDAATIFVPPGSTSRVLNNSIVGLGATINFSALDTLDFVGSQLTEYFALHQTPAGTSMQIFAGDGNDRITLGGGFNTSFAMDDLQSPITIRGEGGLDEVSFIDTAETLPRNYTLNTLGLAAPTMAMQSFDSSIETIVMDCGAGDDTVTVLATFATCPVELDTAAGNDTINITGMATTGFLTVDAGAGLDTVNVNNDNSSVARVRFTNSQDLAALNLFFQGTVSVDAGANAVIDTKAFTFNTTNSLLDLNDNDMIIDWTGSNPIASIQSRINLARAGGGWTVNQGITSTSAKTRVPRNTTLGVMHSGDYIVARGTNVFDGRTIDDTAVLIKYTYYGDADFNGRVNFDDYSRTDLGFNQSRTGWLNGDFDGNGQVNFDDYSLLDLAFNSQSGVL